MTGRSSPESLSSQMSVPVSAPTELRSTPRSSGSQESTLETPGTLFHTRAESGRSESARRTADSPPAAKLRMASSRPDRDQMPD